VLYSREVVDARSKTHTYVEDETTTVVNDAYSDVQILKPGVPCEGKPSGRMERFDVVYAEHPLPGADGDSLLTHKEWNAPQLGCYPIVQEWVGQIHGQSMDTKQTLVSIKVGEPDPWYFKVPAHYTRRTADEWMDLMKPILKQ
jgi:hypothetical protein